MKRWIICCAVAALVDGLYLLMAVTGAEPQSMSRSEIPRVVPVPVDPIVMNRREQPRFMAGIERSTPGPADAKDSEDRSPPGAPPTGDEMRTQIEILFA